NTSKIIETIHHHLPLNLRQQINQELLKPLTHPFLQTYNYFNNTNFFHYTNTPLPSPIYPTHPAHKNTYKPTPPSFTHIHPNIPVLIYQSINFNLIHKKP
ncbi:hypothetical protein, partial [Priestia megaterium]|uniref:hypothetical protein n=1 Tax=Priestia megaterium TaxID=1404 RepID=UPI001F2FE350